MTLSPWLLNLATGLIVAMSFAFLISDFIANSQSHAVAIRAKATVVGGACFVGLLAHVVNSHDMLAELIPRLIIAVASALVSAAARRLFS